MSEQVLFVPIDLTYGGRADVISVHAMAYTALKQLFNDNLNGRKILDIGCGWEFPGFLGKILKLDQNYGPVLARALVKNGGAEVTGLDQQHTLFKSEPFTKKRGEASRVGRYFPSESFDAVCSTSYFGMPSSRMKRKQRPDLEYKTMEGSYNITKPGGYGVHFLLDGFWQLDESDLEDIGYEIVKYFGPGFDKESKYSDKDIIDSFMILRKPD